MKRKLFHLRAHDALGLMSQGGITLALHFDEDKLELYYGASIGIHYDMFSRKQGRRIAFGRLDKLFKAGKGFCRGKLTGINFGGIRKAMEVIVRTSLDQLEKKLRDTPDKWLKLRFLHEHVLIHHLKEGLLKEREEVKEE